MDLYQITKSGLKAVEKSAFDLERDIRALVEANLGYLFMKRLSKGQMKKVIK